MNSRFDNFLSFDYMSAGHRHWQLSPVVTSILVVTSVLVAATSASAANAGSTVAANAGADVQTKSPIKSAVMLKGQVVTIGALTEEVQSDLGLTCERDEKNRVNVAKVRLGSEAYYGGVQKGDKILQARADAAQFMLNIERDGKTYQIKLRRLGGKPDTSLPIATARKSEEKWPVVSVTEPNKTVQQQMMKLLACYDVILFIDRSGSMNTTDCPQNLSRWQWCQQQATGLVQSMKPYIKGGITIVTFNGGFDTYDRVNLDTISAVFENVQPRGSTDLVDPLKFEFDKYFGAPQTKPLLIAVITDGLPTRPSSDPALLRDTLIDCTNRMKDPREVIVTFLQIGDFGGQRVVVDLDENLVSEGARYDIVNTKTFEELKDIGLPRAMVDAILASHRQVEPPQSVANPSAISKSATSSKTQANSKAVSQPPPTSPASSYSSVSDAIRDASQATIKLQQELRR
jgi:hypothetical protein